MKGNIVLATLLLTSPLTFSQETTVINGLDFGPLAKLVEGMEKAGGVEVAPGQEGTKVGKGGIAESQFMTKNTTTDFYMTLDFSEESILSYSQTTALDIYGKPFSHTDAGTLEKNKVSIIFNVRNRLVIT